MAFAEYPDQIKTWENKELRYGNFTSSEIAALMKEGKNKGSFGVPAYTYIQETNMERKLGRMLGEEFTSRETSWGDLMELRVFSLLEKEYSVSSKKTIQHPTIDCWTGTPDSIKSGEKNTICDIKGPYTLKSFCLLIDLFEKGGISAVRETHRQGDKYYYQLVSNACLTGCSKAELIVYMPYQSELQAIRELATSYDGPDQYRFKWIAFAADDELPYLIDGGEYKNLNKLSFEIPFMDKQALHERVVEASRMLIPRKSVNPVTA